MRSVWTQHQFGWVPALVLENQVWTQLESINWLIFFCDQRCDLCLETCVYERKNKRAYQSVIHYRVSTVWTQHQFVRILAIVIWGTNCELSQKHKYIEPLFLVGCDEGSEASHLDGLHCQHHLWGLLGNKHSWLPHGRFFSLAQIPYNRSKQHNSLVQFSHQPDYICLGQRAI